VTSAILDAVSNCGTAQPKSPWLCRQTNAEHRYVLMNETLKLNTISENMLKNATFGELPC
jgi:hypothetical protein